MIEPKYLTAAALAWTVVSASQQDARKVPKAHSTSDDDDTDVLDCIPEIEVEDSNAKKRVVPVVVKPLKATVTSPSLVSSPTHAKVSAAAMRQLESRRRVRSAMLEHNKKETTTPIKAYVSSGASVASVLKSPKDSSARKTGMTTPPATTATTASIRTPPSVRGSPPSVVDCRPVHFKIKSTTTGTVLRFQCVPTYENLYKSIVERLRRGGASSLWSSASNMLSSTLDYAANSDAIYLQFEDAEGDWCTLTNDDDLQDALEASMGRKDSMVRLTVQEQGAATRVWQSFSTKLGW